MWYSRVTNSLWRTDLYLLTKFKGLPFLNTFLKNLIVKNTSSTSSTWLFIVIIVSYGNFNTTCKYIIMFSTEMRWSKSSPIYTNTIYSYLYNKVIYAYISGPTIRIRSRPLPEDSVKMSQLKFKIYKKRVKPYLIYKLWQFHKITTCDFYVWNVTSLWNVAF